VGVLEEMRGDGRGIIDDGESRILDEKRARRGPRCCWCGLWCCMGCGRLVGRVSMPLDWREVGVGIWVCLRWARMGVGTGIGIATGTGKGRILSGIEGHALYAECAMAMCMIIDVFMNGRHDV
jgi:hypothetical protein